MNSMISALAGPASPGATSTHVTSMVQTKIGIRNIVMPGRAHLEDRDEEVDGAQDRARPDEDQRHDPEVRARAAYWALLRQRRVAGPAGRGRATGDQEARGHEQAGERAAARTTAR